jgi:hypothetical protein
MPRRQITDGVELDASELPELTAQQMKFVEGVLAGKTASDAYRAAYDTSSMLAKTVWAEASRLRAHPEVTAWLAAARKANLGTAVLTKEAHMQELERLREIALDSGNIGAAVQAEQLRGKVAGHHIEKVQSVPADTDPVDKLRDIERKHGPEIAAALAAKHGIAFQPSETRH